VFGSWEAYDGGWALPSIEQLFSIVVEWAPPTIDGKAFPDSSGAACWSSSVEKSTGGVWTVHFLTGMVNLNVSEGNPIAIRCVR
jgi:hypothetical protein